MGEYLQPGESRNTRNRRLEKERRRELKRKAKIDERHARQAAKRQGLGPDSPQIQIQRGDLRENIPIVLPTRGPAPQVSRPKPINPVK